MNPMDLLKNLRQQSKKRETEGLSDQTIESFLKTDPDLGEAISLAHENVKLLEKEGSEIFKLDELSQADFIQQNLVNFYESEARNPYTPIAAKGPWIVTTNGAVIHDSGGYGMLGHGHAPNEILKAMSQHHVMANVMTASPLQRRMTELLLEEIGCTRKSNSSTMNRFLFMNSGSEAMSVALRLSDAHAAKRVKESPDMRAGQIKFVSLNEGFHGRTDRPAQVSSSCMTKYRSTLQSYQARDNLITIQPNNLDALYRVFEEVHRDKGFIEAFVMEPVMGEGNPGLAITPEFYDHARKLTKKYHSMLIVDSVQAGLRTHGYLSMIDYPGFQSLETPDMEAFSKAINGGQYPLSLLAMTEDAAKLYKPGIYGNTMTGNPKALAVGIAALEMLTPELRKNIQDRGKEAVKKLNTLAGEFPNVIEKVQGTGLIFSIAINPKVHDVLGPEGLEAKLRKRGIGVIHGSTNSLRFTPVFRISSEELDLIITNLREVLKEPPSDLKTSEHLYHGPHL